jgi:Ca2+/H+ antiporter, TMEM165/GDT1 family
LVAVGLAEMGDKTQLSILLLSSRTKEYIQLLLGVMLAFLLADGFAILMLALVDQLLPFRFRFTIIPEGYYFFGRIDISFEPLPNERLIILKSMA